MLQHSFWTLGSQALTQFPEHTVGAHEEPTECMTLSSLTLAAAHEGSGALGWSRNGRCF